jgi:hypothetical protein
MKRKIKTPAPIVPPTVEAVQKPVAAEKPSSVEPKESITTTKEGQNLVWVDLFPNEQARKAESDLLDAIYQSELSIRRIKAEIDEYASRFDRLQAEYQQASNARTELLRDLPAQLIAARQNRPIGVVRAEAERLETGGTADESDFTGLGPTEILIASSDPSVLPGADNPEPEYVDDGAWREFDARAAIEGIERLGEGRLNAIVAEYATLGDLADAKERAKLEKKPFMNMLPKGTGPKVAAGIEAVLDAAAAGKLKAKLSPAVSPNDPNVSKDVRIARSIYRSISALTEDELRDGADENWVDGSEAWNAGKTIDDAASLGLEMSALTSWIRGWACTERYAARVGSSAAVVEETADGGKVEEAAESDNDATEYNSAEVYDEKHLKFVRDMLKWFADGRRGEADRRSASNVDLWDLGFWSFGNDEPAEECPVEYEKPNGEWGKMQESDQVDWLRGWYFGSTAKEVDPKFTKTKESATTEPPLAAKPPRTLADVIAEVEAESSPRKSKANQLAFGKGYSAGIMKAGITTCPYDAALSDAVAKDWVRGYLEGSSISDDDEL